LRLLLHRRLLLLPLPLPFPLLPQRLHQRRSHPRLLRFHRSLKRQWWLHHQRQP
jgi:hypothetical protein